MQRSLETSLETSSRLKTEDKVKVNHIKADIKR